MRPRRRPSVPASRRNAILQRIVSGGQTGVDRAALNVAIAAAIPCGGWCPLGRRAEDGPLPLHYPLKETDSPQYDVRTRLNVREADGTLIITRGPLRGGTALTVDVARRMARPVHVIDLRESGRQHVAETMHWLQQQRVRTLNVAGPRESQQPGIYSEAQALLLELVGAVRAMTVTLGHTID